MTTAWARRGSRPAAVRQTRYDYLRAIAAACPATGAAAGIVTPRLDAETIDVFPGEFPRQPAPDAHAVPIWDGAGFHTAKTLEVPADVSSTLLPPYSPEPNPIENPWHYLRSRYWSNRSYPDREALMGAAIAGMVIVGTDVDLIKQHRFYKIRLEGRQVIPAPSSRISGWPHTAR